jgi:hypothetical protein
MPIVWITLGIVLVIALFVLVKSYDRWLDRQSVIGVWIAQSNAGRVKIQFEGRPNEGVYRQITESAGNTEREFGYWHCERERLSLRIMATDIRNHSRFGSDTPYRLTYLNLFHKPIMRIKIDGPGRSGIIYRRAKNGVAVTFDDTFPPTTAASPT